jgi:uncharacterized membrane protein YccC
MAHLLPPLVGIRSDMLRGLWAIIATVFVFRQTGAESLSAAATLLTAASVSFVLCFSYLWFLPFTAAGLTILVGAGTLIMMLLGRRDAIVMTGIATSVVMMIASMNGDDAWHEPLLRLIDSIVGMGVALACRWIGSFLFSRYVARSAQ